MLNFVNIFHSTAISASIRISAMFF